MNGTLTTADGLKLAYYVDDFTDPWRKPDTLLLLHAAMGNSQRWFQWVPRLARQYRVVRFDLRGHGNTQFRFDLVRGFRHGIHDTDGGDERLVRVAHGGAGHE